MVQNHVSQLHVAKKTVDFSENLHINGLVHDCGNFSVLAMELPQTCIMSAISNKLWKRLNVDEIFKEI